MFDKLLKGAELAKLGYQDDNKILNGVRIVADNDSAFLFEKNEILNICIEGSNADLDDWLENGNCPMTSDEFGNFHQGFSFSAVDLGIEIFDHLKSNDQKIKIYGHSRGGTIGLYLAMFLDYYNYNVLEVYSYGAPRGASKRWVESFKKTGIKHYRVVNGGDRVPRLPSSWLGYRHDCDAIKLKGSWWSRIWPLGYIDHGIEKYIKTLAKLI